MGDFSQSPLDVLLSNRSKGYIGLHIEQGVPILDRDLNLLHDLISASVREIVARYVGDGTLVGSEGFAITEAAPANDFIVGAGPSPGTALVGGIEITISADTNYNAQEGIPSLITPDATQPDPRVDLVYLDVWLREVGGDEDADLLNSADVGMETSVRQGVEWLVRVAEGVPIPPPANGHAHYALARLTRPRNQPQIKADMITDLREPMAPLTDVERRIRALETFLLLPAFASSPNQFNPKFGMPGANITLFGRNFSVGAVAVRFGTTAATVVGTPTNSQIVARVPKMAAGPTKITVETSGGTATSDDDFTVLAPPAPAFNASPNQFNPKFGAAGSNVTLFGTNFDVAPVTVRFGTTSAAIVGTPTATQIVATVPAMSTGPTTITVQTGGGSVASSDTFTVV